MNPNYNILVKELRLDLETLRTNRVNSLRAYRKYESSLREIVSRFEKKFLATLNEQVALEYTKVLNKLVSGAVDKRGRDVQKKRFKKGVVPDSPNMSTVDKEFQLRLQSLIQLELERKKREYVMRQLFKNSDQGMLNAHNV